MANTLAVAFDIDQPAAAVEISTNSGTSWAALSVPATGTHKTGNLLNVTAGTYAPGVIKLRAVDYPGSVVSNAATVTVVGAATGGTAYDGPIQFRPTTAATQQTTSFSANERFSLGAVTNTASGITDEARLLDGAWLSYTDFNVAVAALPEVEITSGYTFALRRTSATAQLLTADIAFAYLPAQPYGATAIQVRPAARDYAANLHRTDFADYQELDTLSGVEIETNATSLTYAQYGVQNGSSNRDGVAVFDGTTLVTAALPAANGAVETQTVSLPGTGTRRVRVVNSTQQRNYDAGTIGGVFLAHAGFTLSSGATARLIHPTRQPNRLVLVVDSILSGIISDGGTSPYVGQRDSSIALLRAALPAWEVYVLGYGGAQVTGSLGSQGQRDAAAAVVANAFAGATGKRVVYLQRGINDWGQGNKSAVPNDVGDAIGRLFDTVRLRTGDEATFVHQSLFPSSYETDTRPWSDAVRARLLSGRPYVRTAEGPAILPLSGIGPDGLHGTIAGQQTLATNLQTFLTTL
jgi:hypothetical protein